MVDRMRNWITALLLAALVISQGSAVALAASREELQRDAAQALKQLYASEPAAKLLGKKAKAMLVFPNIVKAGFMFGGQIGEGVLHEGRQGRPATTTRWRRPTGSRPARRSSATRSSS